MASLEPPNLGAADSLRDRLAQLMMVRLGSDMPPPQTAEEDEQRVARLLDECLIGGLVLFNGTYADTPATLARLQARSQMPLLIAADLERGVGQQLRPFPLVPHAMAFDRLGEPAADAVAEFARLTGQAARQAGIHIAFGPVADVNSDPRNPIIATRAFGADPRRVAELAAAYLRGCRESGMLAAVKHFPGHGDTHEDSHDAAASVEAPWELLEERELSPFRAAIDASAPLVMTAHVRYPALDPTGAPATFSRPIITGLLRDELRFDGAVVSDSLLMDGARVSFASEGAMALAALNAGVDLLLDLATPRATLDFLELAVQGGRLPRQRVDEAFGRVQRLKASTLADAGHVAAVAEAELRQRTAALALRVARGAIHIANRDGVAVPLRRDRPLCAVLIDPFQRPRNMPAPPLGDLLRAEFKSVDYHELAGNPPAQKLGALGRAFNAADQALVAFVVKPAAWHKFGLPPPIRSWLQELAARRPIVAACLGAPQGLEPLGQAAVQICTYSDVPASQQALVERLVGEGNGPVAGG